jgi:uncharacterized membrane protein
MDQPTRSDSRWLSQRAEWGEALHTALWLIPTLMVVGAGALFVVTYALDRAAFHGDLSLPDWVNNGSADAAREILIGIAGSVITVVGVVFSVTIVALTLASTQFGPRILRNFLRDRGTQLTLGTFVATFVYAVLALGSISNSGGRDFVPHISVSVTLVLVLVDLGVLIYFIHHVATSIQLPQVIASIAADLSRAIDAEVAGADAMRSSPEYGSEVDALLAADREWAPVPAPTSGYLQFVGYPRLVRIASDADAVVQMLYRPGHFLVQGLPMARVSPPAATSTVTHGLQRAHVTGAHRTLRQDLAFAIDQLVEIAIRALSPAVNDTFTALTCIDWLGDGLCKISARWNPTRVHRDVEGHVRVITAEVSFTRLVERAFDKIRQAGRGMPAVMIRQLDTIGRVLVFVTIDEQRAVLVAQADMILRSAYESVSEPADVADVRARFDALPAARTQTSAVPVVPR